MKPNARVYVLTDEYGAPRYIGQTTHEAGDRRMWHWYNRRYNSGNMRLKHWLRSQDTPPAYVVLEDDIAYGDRYETEAGWTVCFRWAGAHLLNQNTGPYPSDEVRAKLSASKTPEVRARIAEKMTGRIVSEETRARISASVRAYNERRRAVTVDAA